jgi:hypothetical protein
MRAGDNDEKRYFRSERIFTMNGDWYYFTREGECGPYPSREIARRELARYVSECQVLDSANALGADGGKLTTISERMRGYEKPGIPTLDAPFLS